VKIERINEEQIKFTLNKEDLHYHNVKYSDLAQGNAKLHDLFREMMTQAMLEHNFNTDPNTPLIVETVPLQNDSVMIIVTKTAAQDYIENKFSPQPRAREERRYRRKPFIDPPATSNVRDVPVYIYMFKSLDEVGTVAARLRGSFRGQNSVCKHKNKYYLVLHNENNQNNMEHIEMVLMEYGQKHSQSIVYKLHLDEYGEVILRDEAIERLADIY
jgi:adapter protein MecA 1/2